MKRPYNFWINTPFDSYATASTILKILKVSKKLRALLKVAHLVTEPRLLFRPVGCEDYLLFPKELKTRVVGVWSLMGGRKT